MHSEKDCEVGSVIWEQRVQEGVRAAASGVWHSACAIPWLDLEDNVFSAIGGARVTVRARNELRRYRLNCLDKVVEKSVAKEWIREAGKDIAGFTVVGC